MSNSGRTGSRARMLAAWGLTVALIALYVCLPNAPGTEDDASGDPSASGGAAPQENPEDPRKPEIVRVRPTDPSPGSAVSITYVGTPKSTDVLAFAGREPLEVLSRHPGSIVAQLPPSAPIGHLKLRVSTDGERSKPYDVTVKPRDYRKPFRSLAGGLALLLIGTVMLARGARAVVGLDSASQLARLVKHRAAAVGFGTVVGALTQSTTAAAGLLSALVGGGVLAVSPASMAFFGAGFAASVAPFVVTGLIEPRDGPLAIAIGVLWFALAPDRRASAIGRLLLGAGFLSFGLYILRPGFEPFLSDPELLSVFRHLRGNHVVGIAQCALLGAALVAIFQGPAPVVMLVLALAEATGLWDLQTALAVLSGTSLGAALAALLTTQPGPRSRHLAAVNLAGGAIGTAFAAATVQFWSTVADYLVRGSAHEIHWGKRVLLPNLGWHLVAGFALSQLTATVLVSALVPWLERRIARAWPKPRPGVTGESGAVDQLRESLLAVLSLQDAALGPVAELSLHGVRGAGRRGEHHLSRAREIVEASLSETVPRLPAAGPGSELGRLAFTCLQLQRSLEAVLVQAERLTDARLATRGDDAEAAPLLPEDEGLVQQIQQLLREGVTDAAATLKAEIVADLDAFRDREIRMNGIEARARGTLVEPHEDASILRSRLGVLELIDACEVAGNQIYRFAQALGDADAIDRGGERRQETRDAIPKARQESRWQP